MMGFEPFGGDARNALYNGTILRLEPTRASLGIVDAVVPLLKDELGEDYRRGQFAVSGEEFFHVVGRVRKILFEDERFHDLVRRFLESVGFSTSENAFDPLKLRASMHAGHDNPRAVAVYSVHRDTWYSHPPTQITWWVALHDAESEETFVFYPEFFERRVRNDSGEFDYGEWITDARGLKIGWQDYDAGLEARYPSFRENLDGVERLGFSCKAGEVIVFSGTHLHQTLANVSGRTRFSVDFRTVHLGDHAEGLGAPDVDNCSNDGALADYIHPVETSR